MDKVPHLLSLDLRCFPKSRPTEGSGQVVHPGSTRGLRTQAVSMRRGNKLVVNERDGQTKRPNQRTGQVMSQARRNKQDRGHTKTSNGTRSRGLPIIGNKEH